MVRKLFSNNLVNHWSEVPHPSHVITHGTTDDFDDATPSTGMCVLLKEIKIQLNCTGKPAY